jgi:hypothetical protein
LVPVVLMLNQLVLIPQNWLPRILPRTPPVARLIQENPGHGGIDNESGK